MRDTQNGNGKGVGERLVGSLMLLCFGCLMLGYLVAIDHVEWFSLRPVSGTAAAMSNASSMQEHPAPTASRRIEKAADAQ